MTDKYFDIAPFIKQLELLNYTDDEIIYIREFKGKQATTEEFKAAGLPFQQFYKNVPPKNKELTFKQLKTKHSFFQDSNRGIYFVVNGGGTSDKEVKTGRAIFIEHDLKDNLTKEEQRTLWTKLDLPEPTFQVETRSSIHQYWSFEQPIPIDKWRILQEDIINLTGADPTNKNPSRVFRVAQGWHIAKDLQGQFLPDFACNLISESGKKYSYSELRTAIPSKKIELPTFTANEFEPIKTDNNTNTDLKELLEKEILPRLSPEVLYNWSGHNFKSRNSTKLEGSCPWHASTSGTSFYTDYKDGQWLWRCCACDVGGNVINYRHRLAGGSGTPRGKDFIEIVQQLANEAGVNMPEFKPTAQKPACTTKTSNKEIDQNQSNSGLTIEQRVRRDLYNKNYKSNGLSLFKKENFEYSLNDTIHKGFYYTEATRGAEQRRILEYLSSEAGANWIWKPAQEKNGIKTEGYWEPVYSYAKASAAIKCFDYVLGILWQEINADPVLHFQNGILEEVQNGWNSNGKPILEHKLRPYNDQDFPIGKPEIIYNPNADRTEADRLLSCLEPEARKIYLQTISQSLFGGIASIEKFMGPPRTLILKGDGRNGKDALRNVIAKIMGSKIGDIDLNKFQDYDLGKKFGLAPIENIRLNYASENSEFVDITKLQGWKQVTACGQVIIERKYCNGYEIKANTINIFSMNRPPRLDTALPAVRERIAVIPFDKTYVTTPDPTRNELQADPRFNSDPNFITENLAPALLNYLLEARLEAIATGINYAPVAGELTAIEERNSHLRIFCREMHFDYTHPQDFISFTEIWDKLYSWYGESGYVEITGNLRGETKRSWTDTSKWDKCLRGANQIRERLSILFPKAKIVTQDRKMGFLGLGFNSLLNTAPVGITPEVIKLEENIKIIAPVAIPKIETIAIKRPIQLVATEEEKEDYQNWAISELNKICENPKNADNKVQAIKDRLDALKVEDIYLKAWHSLEIPKQELIKQHIHPAGHIRLSLFS